MYKLFAGLSVRRVVPVFQGTVGVHERQLGRGRNVVQALLEEPGNLAPVPPLVLLGALVGALVCIIIMLINIDKFY